MERYIGQSPNLSCLKELYIGSGNHTLQSLFKDNPVVLILQWKFHITICIKQSYTSFGDDFARKYSFIGAIIYTLLRGSGVFFCLNLMELCHV